jgi:proline iminopeptidase
MLRQKEITWFYQHGASEIFPDAWAEYLKPIPPEERHDLVQAYHRRLTSEDYDTRIEAAKAWSVWEGSTSKLIPSTASKSNFANPSFAETFARIECHYFVNQGFFETEDQLLKNIVKIRHIPAVIVQGRYDIVCPMVTAWDLHQAWSEAEFILVPNAGHSAFEQGIQTELINATDRFAAI